MTVMLMGAGYSARAFARLYDGHVFGTTRSENNIELLRQNKIEPIVFDFDNGLDRLKAALNETTHLLISISPDENGDILLRHQALLTNMPALKWVGYLSTIGVYGNHNGQWVDESSHCNTTLLRNKIRLEAEKNWLNFATTHNVPLATLRLGGIYGQGRNAFIKLASGHTQRIIKPDQVFNRIHEDDIAGIIKQFSQNLTGGLFNLVDNEPAPPQDVISYAAELMGITLPPATAFDEAKMSAMARSFYSNNKRISNKKLLSTGYTLKQPNYQLALSSMWHNDSWR